MSDLVFDRRLVRARLARARARGFADFLVAHAAGELEERLAAVLREFPTVIDLGTPTRHAARVMARRPGTTHVLRLSPLP